jgi:hypothetical protein
MGKTVGKAVCPICFYLACPCSKDGPNGELNPDYQEGLSDCPTINVEDLLGEGN